MTQTEQLADMIEKRGDELLKLIVGALREHAGGDVPASRSPAGQPLSPNWHEVGAIENFEHSWPEVHEHYGPMTVWEGRDEQGLVRFAIGKPKERIPVYGKTRGWISVWEVVNGQPREQRAVFLETDDFDSTGDHIAVISGKAGSKKGGFAPGEINSLPLVYKGLRIEVHRDRCDGPYAKNRLAVVAREDETEAMLTHALAHLRLRS